MSPVLNFIAWSFAIFLAIAMAQVLYEESRFRSDKSLEELDTKDIYLLLEILEDEKRKRLDK